MRLDTFTADAEGIGSALVAAQPAAIARPCAHYYGCTSHYLADDQFLDGNCRADVSADRERDI